MMWCEAVLACLVALGLVYVLVALVASESFFPRRDKLPESAELPPVSILKLVKGLDRRAHDNFAYFCRRNHPRHRVRWALAGLDALGGDLGKSLLRNLDRLLRGLLGVQEFSDDPRCLFRVSLMESDRDFTLADGTPVHRGDHVADLHFWNEHLPPIAPSGVDMDWAAQMRHQGVCSFIELADAVGHDKRLRQVKAWRAIVALRAADQVPLVNRLMRSIGFVPAGAPWPTGGLIRWPERGDDLLRRLLTWAFNPGGMRGRSLVKLRQPYWISQRAMLARYAETGSVTPAAASALLRPRVL